MSTKSTIVEILAGNCKHCGKHAELLEDDGFICSTCSIISDFREMSKIVKKVRCIRE